MHIFIDWYKNKSKSHGRVRKNMSRIIDAVIAYRVVKLSGSSHKALNLVLEILMDSRFY